MGTFPLIFKIPYRARHLIKSLMLHFVQSMVIKEYGKTWPFWLISLHHVVAFLYSTLSALRKMAASSYLTRPMTQSG